jgi:hypothetical protein
MGDECKHCRDRQHYIPRSSLSGRCLAGQGASTITGWVLDDTPRRCEAFTERTAQTPVRGTTSPRRATR